MPSTIKAGGATKSPLSALSGACTSILTNGNAPNLAPAVRSDVISHLTLPPGAKSVVTLRASTINNMASLLSTCPSIISAVLVKVISARLAAIFAAAGATDTEVAILDSGATHHLWHSHEAFISYHRVYNQYVPLADNSKTPIARKGVIAINVGGKNVIICDVYHVPALRLPPFSLRIHRRIPGCGYHSDNKGVLIFFPSFSLEVDDEVDNYVTCQSLGRSIKDFDYIQPRASPKSAAAGSAPRRSPRLNPPPSEDSLAWSPVRSTPAAAPAPRRSTRLNPPAPEGGSSRGVSFASPPPTTPEALLHSAQGHILPPPLLRRTV